MSDKKLVLIGGGGHCKSVLDAVLRSKKYSEIVITDPDIQRGTVILGCRVVGSDDVLPELRRSGFEEAFITVGSIESTRIRRKLADKLSDSGFRFPVIADISASISDFASVGEGTFIGKNAVVNADAIIKEHCIVNTGAIIEHECMVGSFSHISVGAVLCGNVRVGDDCLIGAGSTVIQGVTIGNSVIIGANSTVLSDTGENIKAYGILKGNGRNSE